jgi:hypothetical protein
MNPGITGVEFQLHHIFRNNIMSVKTPRVPIPCGDFLKYLSLTVIAYCLEHLTIMGKIEKKAFNFVSP